MPDRRSFLRTAAALAAAPLVAPAPVRAAPVRRFAIEAKAARVALVGDPHPATAVWSFNAAVPGPELRAKQGERLRVAVTNSLPETTSVHWHDPAVAGLRMWMALLYERDWNKVRTTFWETQRGPKRDSGVMNAMSWYYTLIEGHPELALNARQQAIALDPENLIFQIDRGHQLLVFGRYDDAVRAFRSLPPEKIQLEDYSNDLLYAGDLAGAKEVATRVFAGRPNALTQANLAVIHAKSGAPDEARKILRELEAQAEKGMHIPYAWIARSYGIVGDFEAARRWLRKGLLEGHGDMSMVWLRSAENLETFGKLAWFWEIVDAMKFPPLQMDNSIN